MTKEELEQQIELVTKAAEYWKKSASFWKDYNDNQVVSAINDNARSTKQGLDRVADSINFVAVVLLIGVMVIMICG